MDQARIWFKMLGVKPGLGCLHKLETSLRPEGEVEVESKVFSGRLGPHLWHLEFGRDLKWSGRTMSEALENRAKTWSATLASQVETTS